MKENNIRNIPVGLIDENGWNGQREADEGLVESIRQDGLLQPICVKKEADGRYTLAFGARRLDAARKLGLEEVPATVLEATVPPEKMRTLTLVENLQRVEQRPIQEGRIFKELMEAGMSMADIARIIGKTPSFVRRRLSLTGLCPQAEAIIEEEGGEYSVEAVAMLAALTPERQMEIIEPNPHYANDPGEMRYAIREVGKLDGAKFDMEDETLVPEAGACVNCKKRTGAEQLLFDAEDWDGDTCLDEECFARKLNAYVGREIARIRKKHPDAPCVVEKYIYEYAPEQEKRIYDTHDTSVLTDWRIAFTDDEKKLAEAKVGILLGSHGSVSKVVLVPNRRQKDGRANKPKTAEEKAAFLEKKRMAWIAKMVQADIATTILPYCEEESAALWMRRLAEAVAMKDMSLHDAAGFLFQKLSSYIVGHLYCDTIGMVDVEKKREAVLRALRVLDMDQDADLRLAELEQNAEEGVR